MLLTRKLAFGGIAAAMVLIAISVSYVSPVADLALFTLSSLFIAMVVIETDFMTGFASYLASGILLTALFGLYFSLPFLALFGLYPLLKGLLEQRMKRLFSYGVKALYFCVLIAAVQLVFNQEAMMALTKWSQLLPSGFQSEVPSVWVLMLAAILVLFLYDFALSLLIGFYQKRIRRAMKLK